MSRRAQCTRWVLTSPHWQQVTGFFRILQLVKSMRPSNLCWNNWRYHTLINSHHIAYAADTPMRFGEEGADYNRFTLKEVGPPKHSPGFWLALHSVQLCFMAFAGTSMKRSWKQRWLRITRAVTLKNPWAIDGANALHFYRRLCIFVYVVGTQLFRRHVVANIGAVGVFL